MAGCTDLCDKLKTIERKHGALPSHDELIAHLWYADDDQRHGRLLGKWVDLLARTQCGFCQLVVTAIRSNGADDQVVDLNQLIHVLLLPGEQSLRLSYPYSTGLRLAFVTDDARSARGPDTARPVQESGIQTSLIGGWLKTCTEKHDKCALEVVKLRDSQKPIWFSSREDTESNFRVIDLELGCVRRAVLHARYVALSYVWGHVPMLRLTKDLLGYFSSNGSLDFIRPYLPRTVNDVIEFVKAMGERYIWIDDLCLVQDDEDDMSLGIKMMNSIYRGAYFTIVAGSGVDANAGLAGFGQTQRSIEQVQVIRDIGPGIKMTMLRSIDWHLRRSTYMSRGWTLQEFVQSRRKLIFINGQIYFQCQEATWSEETWAENWERWLDPDNLDTSTMPDPNDGFMPSYLAYQSMCEEYSWRSLRWDGDALRAFTGISRPLAAGMDTDLVEGLPAYYLDHFLLFRSVNADLRRRFEFASFSWAGWEGRVVWPQESFVWYDGNGERTCKATNILKHLRYDRIVSWGALDSRCCLEDLTFQSNDQPSQLLKLMQEFPNISLDAGADIERERMRTQWWRSHSQDYSVPNWERVLARDSSLGQYENEHAYLELEQRMQLPKRWLSKRVLNVANGKAEFIRYKQYADRVASQLELLELQCIIRHYITVAARPPKVEGTSGPYVFLSHEERELFRFRRPRDGTDQVSRSLPEDLDERRRRAKHLVENRREDQAESENQAAVNVHDIPRFPPYTVLQFLTISIQVVLGSTAERQRQQHSTLGRTSGVPLLATPDQLVGSLHADNLNDLPAPGSSIECLVVSRCNTPAEGSALLALDNDITKPWKLLWVLYVVWRDGIAERRGVGQILSSALETVVDPKPALKSVFLG